MSCHTRFSPPQVAHAHALTRQRHVNSQYSNTCAIDNGEVLDMLQSNGNLNGRIKNMLMLMERVIVHTWGYILRIEKASN